MARYIIAKTLTFLTIPCLVFSYAHADNCFYDPIVAGTEHKLLSPNLNISCPAVVLSLENGTDVPLIVTNSSRCLVRPELSLFVPDTASGQIVLTWGCEAQEGTLEPDDQTMDEQDAEPCIAYEVSPRTPSQTLEYLGSVFSISQSCAVPFQTGASRTRTGSSNAVQGTQSSNVSLARTSTTTAYTETDATRTGTARPITFSAPPSSITPLSTNPASYLSSIDGVSRTSTAASQPVQVPGSVVPSSMPPSSGAGYGVSQYATTPGTPFYTNIASIADFSALRPSSWTILYLLRSEKVHPRMGIDFPEASAGLWSALLAPERTRLLLTTTFDPFAVQIRYAPPRRHPNDGTDYTSPIIDIGLPPCPRDVLSSLCTVAFRPVDPLNSVTIFPDCLNTPWSWPLDPRVVYCRIRLRAPDRCESPGAANQNLRAPFWVQL
ncbi:hypothetical protein G7054_g6668 [Neopestalotiopsis clavispora]|nr:hypothetical protein G7054_g6668 [Neopestalotiopsis clavispora]